MPARTARAAMIYGYMELPEPKAPTAAACEAPAAGTLAAAEEGLAEAVTVEAGARFAGIEADAAIGEGLTAAPVSGLAFALAIAAGEETKEAETGEATEEASGTGEKPP